MQLAVQLVNEEEFNSFLLSGAHLRVAVKTGAKQNKKETCKIAGASPEVIHRQYLRAAQFFLQKWQSHR